MRKTVEWGFFNVKKDANMWGFRSEQILEAAGRDGTGRDGERRNLSILREVVEHHLNTETSSRLIMKTSRNVTCTLLRF